MQLHDLLDQCSLAKDHFGLQDHCELQCLKFLFLRRYSSHVNLVEMLCLSQLEDWHKTYRPILPSFLRCIGFLFSF